MLNTINRWSSKPHQFTVCLLCGLGWKYLQYWTWRHLTVLIKLKLIKIGAIFVTTTIRISDVTTWKIRVLACTNGWVLSSSDVIWIWIHKNSLFCYSIILSNILIQKYSCASILFSFFTPFFYVFPLENINLNPRALIISMEGAMNCWTHHCSCLRKTDGMYKLTLTNWFCGTVFFVGR
jgi:hypothetical protein